MHPFASHYFLCNPRRRTRTVAAHHRHHPCCRLRLFRDCRNGSAIWAAPAAATVTAPTARPRPRALPPPPTIPPRASPPRASPRCRASRWCCPATTPSASDASQREWGHLKHMVCRRPPIITVPRPHALSARLVVCCQYFPERASVCMQVGGAEEDHLPHLPHPNRRGS